MLCIAQVEVFLGTHGLKRLHYSMPLLYRYNVEQEKKLADETTVLTEKYTV